jgi:hypothetical protein
MTVSINHLPRRTNREACFSSACEDRTKKNSRRDAIEGDDRARVGVRTTRVTRLDIDQRTSIDDPHAHSNIDLRS